MATESNSDDAGSTSGAPADAAGEAKMAIAERFLSSDSPHIDIEAAHDAEGKVDVLLVTV